MPIRITCPSCSTALSVRDENAGRAVKCPKCSGTIPVPAAAPPAAPPPLPLDDFDFDQGGAAPPAGSRAPARQSADYRDDDRDDDYNPPARIGSGAGGSGMQDYLTFRKMIVPVVIQVIFWFLVLIVAGIGLIFGVMSLASGKTEAVIVGFAAVLIGVPLYVLLIRMYCEVLIVIFRMNDTLTDIRNLLARRND